MLLTEILPLLANELEQLLKKAGKPLLAAQVSQLMVVERCRCGDDFCASFYTQPKPEGKYGPEQDCMDLEPAEAMLLLDDVGGTIVHVEILNRDDIRQKLINALP